MLAKQRLIWQKKRLKKESAKRQKYQNVPDKVRKEVGSYALIHETKVAVDKYSEIYPKYDLKHVSVNVRKTKCKRTHREHSYKNNLEDTIF